MCRSVRPAVRLRPTHPLARTVYAAGDFDGDGDPDLLADAPNGTLTIYRGDARGRIEPSLNLPTLPPLQIRAVAVGDVDGDGDVDVAIAGPNSVDLLVNGGALTFTVRRVVSFVGARLELVDLDGDGDLDLYVAASGQDAAFENTGGGAFAARNWVPAELLTQDVADLTVGDVDGDGDIDVVLAVPSGPELLTNAGNGSMVRAALPSPASGGAVVGVGLFDPDGDGDLDMLYAEVSASYGPAADSLWQNNGAGVFTPYPTFGGGQAADTLPLGVMVQTGGATAIVLGRDRSVTYPLLVEGEGVGVVFPSPLAFETLDWDGDGLLDVILNGQREYLRSERLASFYPPVLTTTPAQPALPWFRWNTPPLVVDVDGDGDEDLCGAEYNRPVYRNDGFGRFSVIGGSVTGVRGWGEDAGDVDGDGDIDVISVGRVGLFANDGLGGFANVTAGRIPRVDAFCVALIDIDGDGDLDLFAGEYNNGVSGPDRVFANDGTGRFTDVTSLVLPPNGVGAAVAEAADVDGDGMVDLVVSRHNFSVDLLRNQGGRFTRTILPNSGAYINVGDLDGDGDLDIMLEGASRSLEWWPFQGGTYGAPVVLLPGNPFFFPGDRAPLLSDVDLDGDLDAIANSQVWVNDGAGNFAVDPARFIGDSSTVPFIDYVVIDADGDGDDDLVQIQGSGLMINRHRQLEVPVPPQVGVGLTCELYHQPGYGTAQATGLLALAFGRDPSGVDLPSGRLLLDAASTVLVATASLAPGRTDVVLGVPSAPSLVGTQVWFQAAILEANGQIALTNGVATRVE